MWPRSCPVGLSNLLSCNVGEQNGLALPYRGQSQPNLPSDEELQHVPAGLCRSVLVRSCMVRGTVTTSAPSPHAGLGLDGYVQFTSPIRRYGDMLAHFQLKVCLAPFFCSLSVALLLIVCVGTREPHRPNNPRPPSLRSTAQALRAWGPIPPPPHQTPCLLFLYQAGSVSVLQLWNI